MRPPRDWDVLVDALKAQGWTIEKHDRKCRAYPPSNLDGQGPPVFFTTSRERRAILNTFHSLKASGFEWPPPVNADTVPTLPLEMCPICRKKTWNPQTADCENSYSHELLVASAEHRSQIMTPPTDAEIEKGTEAIRRQLGLVKRRDPVLGPIDFQPVGEPARVVTHRTIPRTHYKKLIEVFQRLAQDEICGKDAFPGELLPRMIELGLALESADGIHVHDAKKLAQVWATEQSFCGVAGWPTEHAPAVQLLLDGGASVLEEAAAAQQAFQAIGNDLLSYRTGLSRAHVRDLRHVAELPESVRLFFAAQVPLHKVRYLKGTEEEMLQQLAENEAPVENAECSGQIDVQEAVIACLKISAATAEMLATVDRKLSRVLKELGVRDDPD